MGKVVQVFQVGHMGQVDKADQVGKVSQFSLTGCGLSLRSNVKVGQKGLKGPQGDK
jgi:hypothetical protein